MVHAVEAAVDEVVAQGSPDRVLRRPGQLRHRHPGAEDPGAEQRPAPRGEAAPAPQVAVRGQHHQGNAQGQQQPHRPLGEDGQGGGEPEQQARAPAAGIARPVRLEGGQGHPDEAAEERIRLAPARLVPEHEGGGEDRRRQGRRGGPEEAPAEP